MMAQTLSSTNGGETWQATTPNEEFPNSLKLTAATALIALAAPAPQAVSGTLGRTTDGGRTFSGVLPGPDPSEVSWIGFSDPSIAYAIVNGGLLASSDGGATWRPVSLTG
jgi:photosystem II stability/assembly factor-like uncharacterized protein